MGDPPPPQWNDALAGYRVVLLDLDSTLIRSGRFRKEAARNALAKLCEGWKGDDIPDINECCRADRAIYDCHDEINGQIGPNGYIFEDTRQKWNTRSSKALLIAWHEVGGFPRGTSDYSAELKKVLTSKVDTRKLDELLKRAENILQGQNVELSEALAAALSAFWVDTNLRPDKKGGITMVYEGGVDLLDTLQSASIKYYVATEGDLETQWRKIRAVGLNGRLREGLLLSTGQAARPEDDLNPLIQILEGYKVRANQFGVAYRFLSQSNHAEDGATRLLDRERSRARSVFMGLYFLWQKHSRPPARNSTRCRTPQGDKQVQPEFYKIVLYAINHNLDDPRSDLSSLKMNWALTSRKLRVVMVGDNPQNDIEPIIALGKQSWQKDTVIKANTNTQIQPNTPKPPKPNNNRHPNQQTFRTTPPPIIPPPTLTTIKHHFLPSPSNTHHKLKTIHN